MVKLNNKGFSLVEIIIAVAVFSILIFPITNALVTSTKTGTQSTKKQYAVEKAEEVMETFKKADLSGDVYVSDDNNGTKSGDKSSADAYTFKKGTTTTQNMTLPDSSTASYSVTSYTCNSISIGKTYENYTCEVQVNDAAYQAMKNGYVLTSLDGGATFKTDGTSALKTTVSDTGTVRNLDSKQSAIIIGATYSATAKEHNLDNLAYQYFKDEKLDELKKYDVWYSQYLAGAPVFNNDTCEKNTTIKITKSGSVYTVQCIVEYTDNTSIGVIKSSYENSGKNKYKPTTTYGEGIVYQQEFADELPPIYLLYVPATYDGVYCAADYITVDNTTITDEAKIYIFETTADLSEKYKEIIKAQFGVSDVDDLTYVNSSSSRSKEDVEVRVKLAKGSYEESDKDTLKIYSNFDTDNSSPYYPVMRTSEDESGSVYLYDITVTLKDSEGNETTITGTRGK